MSNHTPDPTRNQFTASAAPASDLTKDLFREPVATGNLPLAILAGSVAALVGAAAWAAITVTTEYQIGFMAVGVGFLVGFAVGKAGRGKTFPFQVTGSVLSLLGCVLGNFFTIVGFASRQSDLSAFAMLGQIDYAAVPGIMAEAASPMDFLFYAIAIYEGFKFSTKY